MARTLEVYLNRDSVGHLIQDDGGQMMFMYADSWLKNPDRVPLSRSLPLREQRFKQNECRGFFGGTLPEEGNRKIVARVLGISEKNDFAMLERIGGECAGAVTFPPEGALLPEDDNRYQTLSNEQLGGILRELPRCPLMVGKDGVRLSLAGAQDKIAVRVEDEKISIPLHGAPSTHILKPAIATYTGVVFNEAFCMALAAKTGLSVAKTTIGRVDDIDYLLIDRYDRNIDKHGQVHRLHQEDLCQALGVPSEIKYQEEGGPSLKDCFDLLRLASSSPVIDLRALLDAVIFNLTIGNHDAHAKNFSLLYMPDRSIRLAPLYDLVSTVYYPELSKKMAMKIGGEEQSDLVLPNNFERFAKDAGLAPSQTRTRVAALAERVLRNIEEVDKPHEISGTVAGLIKERCDRVISRFKRR